MANSFQNFGISSLLLFGLVCIVNGAATPDAGVSKSLLNVMNRAADFEHNDVTLNCFGYYINVLTEIAADYERNYKLCFENADIAKHKLDEDVQAQREDLKNTYQGTCEDYSGCLNITEAYDYFACFEDQAKANVKVQFQIASNASSWKATIDEAYRNIDIERYHCTNKTEMDYAERWATVYQELDYCLEGKVPVPTSAPNTPTTTTTTTTTPSPSPVTTTTATPTTKIVYELPEEDLYIREKRKLLTNLLNAL